MDLEELREYCLSFPMSTEGMPFGETALVIKVFEKMFALISLDKKWINLKCEPERAIELREEYECISPGYHMSKKHWNTIYLDELDINKELLKSLIEDSYNLVCSKLRKSEKEELKAKG